MSISERIYDDEEALAENPNRAKVYKGPFELLEVYKWLQSSLEQAHNEYYGHKPTPVFRDGVIVRQGDGYNYMVEYLDPEPLPMPDPSTLGPWGAAWLAAGEGNDWIRFAHDPPFDIRQFRKCRNLNELATWMAYGNWSIGAAFYFEDQCWINQVNGGSEFLGIKQDVAFESFSAAAIAKHPDDITFWFGKDGASGVKSFLPDDNPLVESLQRVADATVEECRKLEYD